ncbi:hypothetical protein V6N13_124337 [Hibiscus sabdariffa]
MQGLQQFCLNRMTKGMSRQRQQVLPQQKSRLELRSRQSEIIMIQSRALLSFLFCLGRESRQMSVSRQMSFLLISRSFHLELLQYNFLPLVPAAFGFCQGRSVLGRLPEITNKLATVPFYHKICNI